MNLDFYLVCLFWLLFIHGKVTWAACSFPALPWLTFIVQFHTFTPGCSPLLLTTGQLHWSSWGLSVPLKGIRAEVVVTGQLCFDLAMTLTYLFDHMQNGNSFRGNSSTQKWKPTFICSLSSMSEWFSFSVSCAYLLVLTLRISAITAIIIAMVTWKCFAALKAAAKIWKRGGREQRAQSFSVFQPSVIHPDFQPFTQSLKNPQITSKIKLADYCFSANSAL